MQATEVAILLRTVLGTASVLAGILRDLSEGKEPTDEQMEAVKAARHLAVERGIATIDKALDGE